MIVAKSELQQAAARYTNEIPRILEELANKVILKDHNYGHSWMRRGGAHAFAMLARKWDRIENAVDEHGENLFEALAKDIRTESIADDILDLMGYLTLVLAHYEANIKPPEQPVVSTADPRLDQTGMRHPFGYDYNAEYGQEASAGEKP